MKHYGGNIDFRIFNFRKMALRNYAFFLQIGLFYAQFGAGLIQFTCKFELFSL